MLLVTENTKHIFLFAETPSIPQVNALLIPLEYEGENSQIALNRAINGVVQKKPSRQAKKGLFCYFVIGEILEFTTKLLCCSSDQ